MSDLFLGKKYERPMSFHEAAKSFGTSNKKLLELLRKKGILFKDNNRNLPYSKYLKWFEVFEAEVNNSGFLGLVPIVRINKIGMTEIRKIIYENNEFINELNSINFWDILFNETVRKLNDLGFKCGNDYDSKKSLIKNNTVIYNNDSEEYLVCCFINSNKVEILKYVYTLTKKEITILNGK